MDPGLDVPKIQPAKFFVHTSGECFADVSSPQLTCKRGHWARRSNVIKTALESSPTGQTLDDPNYALDMLGKELPSFELFQS